MRLIVAKASGKPHAELCGTGILQDMLRELTGC